MPLHVYSTVDEVLSGLADFFVACAEQAIAAQGRFSVALSGGSSPRKLYELLVSAAYRDKVRWEQVFFFFGDERDVPATDPESNFRMAKEALLDPLRIPSAHVFGVDTSQPPTEAAQAYTQAIQQFFGTAEIRFDMVLLGLGDDAHTASLFPHTSVLHVATVGAQEVFVEEKQVYRITLTAPLINQAHAIAFLVYGANKAAAIEHVLTGARDIQQFPAQLIVPTAGEVHWFLDEPAAAKL